MGQQGSIIRTVSTIIGIVITIGIIVLALHKTYLTAADNEDAIIKVEGDIKEVSRDCTENTATIREFSVEQRYIREKVDDINETLKKVAAKL